MPDFEFTSPEGKKYTVSGPDGSTSAQAFQMLQKQLGTATPTAAPQQSEGVAQGQRILSAIDQANQENGKAFIGAGETVANAVTGVGSSIVGGFRGLAALATGGSLADARKAVETTQQDYTYQPRTGIGKLGSELLTAPVMAAKSAATEIGGDIGQAVGGTKGRMVGESIGEIAPDVAATLAGGRAAMRPRGPSVRPIEQAPATVNYDIPAYQRNGIKPVPEIAGPPEPPVMVGPPAPPELIGPPAPQPMVGPPSIEEVFGIHVPEVGKSMPTLAQQTQPAPLQAYARNPTPSQFGELSEPVVPPATPLSQLDQFAANPVEPRARAVPTQFDDMLRESAPATPDKSPLDSLIAGESAPAKAITAGLRDTSDIDSILQNFGVDVPETTPAASQPIRGPVMPTDSVERATAPIQALDGALRVPEPIPGPKMPVAAPMETVERAVVPAAPIDNAVRVPEVPAERPFVPTPEQHVDPALSERNTQVLRDVGLDKIRYSAVEGKSAEAAREFQHGKFDEPAGHMWDAQFKAETEAMQNYTKQLVDDTKGKTGLDSESLGEKGRDIAAPYDAIRKYFEDGKENLYKIADERAAATGKSVVTQSLDALLADPDFVATLMAKDQQGLLNTIKSQAERFKSLDENGLSVVNAEKFRKWLNKVWSPDKSGTLGEVKAALDADVFRTAGQDVYAQARQMHQLEKTVLDDPTGISKLFDADPRTPINRSTPYEKIPNEIVKLSDDHFKHVIDTYKQLAAEAPELAPVVQQAIDTLKAHYAERILHAGTESVKGNPRGLWDTGSVKTFTDRNSAKLPMIFDANEMQRINTMLQAGEILRVNPAYPGAAAQAANASKAGLMTRMIGKLGGGVGGGAGALIMGPAGAAVGGIAGEAGLSKLAKFAGERKALAEAKARIINEHRTPPTPPSPIDEWEAGHR